jgi:hypothetical protein
MYLTGLKGLLSGKMRRLRANWCEALTLTSCASSDRQMALHSFIIIVRGRFRDHR